MAPVANDPAETKPMPQAPAEYVEWLRGYEVWLRKAGRR
jgi:hypothetical protein